LVSTLMPARIFPAVGMRAGACPSKVAGVEAPPCKVTVGSADAVMAALLGEA